MDSSLFGAALLHFIRACGGYVLYRACSCGRCVCMYMLCQVDALFYYIMLLSGIYNLCIESLYTSRRTVRPSYPLAQGGFFFLLLAF